ncbi:FixH family protein [bacterium]|nr:FixH family protein [bacterium]
MAGLEPSRSALPKLGALVLLVLVLIAGVLFSRQMIGTQRASQAPAGELRLAIAPLAELKAFKPMPFEVTVRTPDGLPLEGAEVRFDLTMPDMEMPLNRFDAQPVPGQPGVYRGEGNFTMGGRWQIEATAKQGDRTGAATELVEISTR